MTLRRRRPVTADIEPCSVIADLISINDPVAADRDMDRGDDIVRHSLWLIERKEKKDHSEYACETQKDRACA
jgi:hypothetical protein